jgi:hypothetical protein
VVTPHLSLASTLTGLFLVSEAKEVVLSSMSWKKYYELENTINKKSNLNLIIMSIIVGLDRYKYSLRNYFQIFIG